MKPYALSAFVLGGIALMVSFPSPSPAQMSSIRRLTPPAPLKVPQSLPSTIYNSSDVHSPLPVPPNQDFSNIKAESRPIREYVFTSDSSSEPIPTPKITRTQGRDHVVKQKVNRTVVKPTKKPAVNQTAESRPIREYIFTSNSLSEPIPTPKITRTQGRDRVVKQKVNRTVVKTITPKVKSSIVENAVSPINPTVATTTLYRVQAKATNDNSLTQVKTVEPLAFVRQTDGFIHAGTFSEKSLAEQRVQSLVNQGVQAEVVAVPNGGTNADNVANLRFTRQ